MSKPASDGDEIPDAEWDDETSVFERDAPDVVKQNMTPVTNEWLLRAYHAIFRPAAHENVRSTFDPDDYPVV